MSGLVPAAKLVTIYKGHDISWYSPRPDFSVSSFGIPADAFVVSCVANLRPVKGIPFLLEALKLLIERGNNDIHALLVGELRDQAGLPMLSDPLLAGRVHSVGYQSDVASIVARSNVFVLPSVEREGLPKAMMEAMSLSTPTIVTNVGGMPEVVRDQRNGLVVAPRSAAELAGAIKLLHGDPELAGRLGAAGQRTIKEEFTVERAVQETAALYAALSER